MNYGTIPQPTRDFSDMLQLSLGADDADDKLITDLKGSQDSCKNMKLCVSSVIYQYETFCIFSQISHMLREFDGGLL